MDKYLTDPKEVIALVVYFDKKMKQEVSKNDYEMYMMYKRIKEHFMEVLNEIFYEEKRKAPVPKDKLIHYCENRFASLYHSVTRYDLEGGDHVKPFYEGALEELQRMWDAIDRS